MQPLIDTLAYAPASRFTLEHSRFLTDIVFGGGFVLLLGLVFALALRAWTRAHMLSEEVWQARGLQRGKILLQGIVERADDHDAVVRLSIHQRAERFQTKGGPQIRWREVSRDLQQHPFVLVTSGGERVRVEPGGDIHLVDRLDPATNVMPETRVRVAQINAGDTIWVRGILNESSAKELGPYRGADGPRYVLRPPSHDALYLSSQPVADEDRSAATFHGRFFVLFLLSFVVCQWLVFGDFRSLRTQGVVVAATITGERQWVTRTKHSFIHHFGWEVEYDGHSFAVETNYAAFKTHAWGSMVPIVYVAGKHPIAQLGRAEELGVDDPMAICVLLFTLTILYAAWAHLRRPWWRRRSVIDVEKDRD